MKKMALIWMMALAFPLVAHEHKAPHGGSLVEIGDEFAHLELVLDADSGKLTAFVLDGEAEKSLRIRQKALVLKLGASSVTLRAEDNPLTGEKPGDCSEFSARSAKFRARRKFEGRFGPLTILGKTFKGLKATFGGP